MAKRRETLERITCPCCGKERSIAEGTPLLAQEEELRRNDHDADPWQWRGEGWSVASARQGFLQWACNRCLKTGRALRGNPSVQTWRDHEPYFAYVDVELRCHDCGQQFIFSASEQQFWYEQLRFWVQSRPKQCVVCRRLRRKEKAEVRARQARLPAADKAASQ